MSGILLMTNMGNLWVGTFMHGLYCIDNGGKITSYTKENSCLYTNTITDLVYSSDHAMLYIGTSTGLYELNTQTQQLAPVKGNDNEVSLIKMHISCLYRDQRIVVDWNQTWNSNL